MSDDERASSASTSASGESSQSSERSEAEEARCCEGRSKQLGHSMHRQVVRCCRSTCTIVLLLLCSWAAAFLGTCHFGADSYCNGTCQLKIAMEVYGIAFYAVIASTALAGCGAMWLWCKATTLHLIHASHFLVLNWVEGLGFLSFIIYLMRDKSHILCPEPWRMTHWKFQAGDALVFEMFRILLQLCELIFLQGLIQDSLRSIWPALNRPRQGVWLRRMLQAELAGVALGLLVSFTGFWPVAALGSTAFVCAIVPILLCFLMWVVLVGATLCQTFSLLQTSLSMSQSEGCWSFSQALRSGRRAALLQGLGLVGSLTTTIVFVITCDLWIQQPDRGSPAVIAGHCLNLLVNAVGVILLSGAYRLCGQPSPAATKPKRCSYTCWSFSHPITRTRAIGGSEWEAKTQELAGRGISVQKLLSFYRRLGKDVMLSYQPDVHTTNDVVRLAIIPLTSTACSSYAQLVVNEGESLMPGKMVTHNWSNLFQDLLASVIADALGEHTCELVSSLLSETSGINALEQVLEVQECLDDAYWICAFAVNQHAGICGATTCGEVDPVTMLPHPVCSCKMPKCFNTTPPLNEHGESIPCEMNKFDDMMSFLACRDPSFAEVVVVDTSLELFNRAWCMAELAEAQRMGMAQSLLVRNKATLLRRQHSLLGLQSVCLSFKHVVKGGIYRRRGVPQLFDLF